MTISTTQSLTIAQGNAATFTFDYNFVADSAADIIVSYTDASGNLTQLIPSQYTLTINPAGPNQLWGIGGTVTYPLTGPPIAIGTSLTIQRILPLTQETSVRNQGNYYAQVTEQALDQLEMQIQQVAARSGQIRGVWITDTQYNYADLVKDGPNGNNSGNYYFCNINNISGIWATDLANGDWVLAIQGVLPTVPLPLSIANGGTGASTAAAAATNLGVASLTATNEFTGTSDYTEGTILVPTAAAGDSSSKAASTEFVNGTALTLAAGTTATTQSGSDNTTKVATTAMVQAAITGVVAPAASVVGNIRNGKMSVTAASATATFTADEVIVETALGGTTQKLASYSQAINLGTTGAGGMDTGSAPNNGFVSLYAIAKSNGTAGILACNVSTSSGSIYGGAHMPSGYTYSALIGCWPTNSSGQFITGIQFDRKMWVPPFYVLNTGTSATSWTSVSLASAVPPIAKTIDGTFGNQGGSGAPCNTLIASDANGTGVLLNITPAAAANYFLFSNAVPYANLPLITAQTIYYQTSASGNTAVINVTSYTF